MNYTLRKAEDFEKLLSFWHKKGHAHPVFYTTKTINNNLCACYNFPTPLYNVILTERVESEEQAADLFPSVVSTRHGLIRHG